MRCIKRRMDGEYPGHPYRPLSRFSDGKDIMYPLTIYSLAYIQPTLLTGL